MSLEERAEARRARMVVHRAKNHADAERWDLDYWQSKTPGERLAALAAIQRDIANVQKAR